MSVIGGKARVPTDQTQVNERRKPAGPAAIEDAMNKKLSQPMPREYVQIIKQPMLSKNKTASSQSQPQWDQTNYNGEGLQNDLNQFCDDQASYIHTEVNLKNINKLKPSHANNSETKVFNGSFGGKQRINSVEPSNSSMLQGNYEAKARPEEEESIQLTKNQIMHRTDAFPSQRLDRLP